MRGEELAPNQAEAQTSNSVESRSYRCTWVRNNPDIVAFLHALRVELQVRLVMQHVVPCADSEPFLYWLRFEWGSNGNPHAHGQAYAKGNPKFDNIAAIKEAKQDLINAGYPEARKLMVK